MTTITKEYSFIAVPVTHYWSLDKITEEVVSFTVYQDNKWFKAIPMLSTDQRSSTGLPAELVFLYSNYCIAGANDMEEDSLTVIKKLILEMEVQDLL